MATQNLTVRSIEGLKPGRTRYEVFDAFTPGLAIRVTPSGHKSWVLFYRYHGRLRRLTLGRYSDRKLAEARKEALNQRGRILNGADPATEKHDERATYGDTVGALYDLYKKATEKKRSWPEQRGIFENEVLPEWRHRRVQDMTRRDIRTLVEKGGDGADHGEPDPGARLAIIQLRGRARLD
jgi:hypothetical protein